MNALSPQTLMLGNPPVKGHAPNKLDFIGWMQGVESLAAGGGLSYVNDSLANLDLREGATNDQFALVLNAEEEAGVYERIAGDWAKVAGIPAILIESIAAAEAKAAAAEAAASEATVVAKVAVAVAAAIAAQAAAEVTGDVEFFDTWADANAGYAALPIDQIVEVLADEQNGGNRARYRREPGGLVLKAVMGSLLSELSLLDATGLATALGYLGLGPNDVPAFGNFEVDGWLHVLEGVTGGGHGLRIGRTGDRVYLAVTDQAGSFLWTRELAFDPADDCWTAEGGFKVKSGMITVDGGTFEKLALKRSDTNKHAGLFVHSDGLASIRTDGDRSADKASAIFENSGPEVSDPAAVITKEKGDARYLQAGVPPFASAELPFAGGVLISTAHGLGRVPAMWRVAFRCKVAGNGYAVGDEIPVTGMVDGDGARGVAAWANASSLSYFVDVAAIQNTTADYIAPTATDWRVVFYAW